jgi:hypothetical protein
MSYTLFTYGGYFAFGLAVGIISAIILSEIRQARTKRIVWERKVDHGIVDAKSAYDRGWKHETRLDKLESRDRILTARVKQIEDVLLADKTEPEPDTDI